MNAAFDKSIKDRDLDTRKAAKSGAVVRLARALGLGVLVALGGLLCGLGVLRATNVFQLVPHDEPQIWVKSGCGAAEAVVRAAQHATPEEPVFLIPLDQSSETTKNACQSTLAALDHKGGKWLRYFPERWLCQRFADEASARLGDEPVTIPRFYAGGQLICDGICEGAFERLGHPELQQFVTYFSLSP